MKAKELFIRQIARLTGETHYLFQNASPDRPYGAFRSGKAPVFIIKRIDLRIFSV